MLQINFGLAWLKSGKPAKSAFKQSAAFSLFNEYTERISKFTSCRVSGFGLSTPDEFRAQLNKAGPAKIWVCDRGPGSRILSSEDVGQELTRCLDDGTKNLWILIGGPDGFTKQQLQGLKPNLVWCFGKFTLPHELAAIVSSEQVYRAWTIVKGLPYHSGH